MPIQALPYLLLLGFFFGTTLIASRFSVGQFEATTYIWLRLALASLGHAAIFAFSRRLSWPRDPVLWRRAALLGIFDPAVSTTALVVSLQFQSSGVTAILLTTGPAITAILAHFTLSDEKLDLRKILGISLALGGAVFLAVRGESGLPEVTRGNPLGYILVLGALVIVGVAAIYTRKMLRAYDALDVASIRMVTASAVLIPFSLLTVGFDLSRVDANGYLALVWAGVFGTFGAFLLSFYIVQRFGATPSALVGYIIPIIASIGGVFILGETITPGMLAGMALILGGITLLNERAAAKNKAAQRIST
jgi:drug/metabolite transporter (DMT)-like permease